MAKGDRTKLWNAAEYEKNYLNDRLENYYGMVYPNWGRMVHESEADRASDKADYGRLQEGFSRFAEDGGFSPQDISAFRARAAAPIRAGYSNALREVDRARTLNGGSMPGYAVLRSRLNRDSNQAMSDAAINSNAAIAQMVQQGKLAGLQGGSNLYGTTPGWSSMSYNNLFRAGDQAIDVLKSDIASRLGILDTKSRAAGIPGSVAQTFGGIGSFIKDIGQGISGAAAPWGA